MCLCGTYVSFHSDGNFCLDDLIVFAGKRKLIFVHGCFWHGHDCKRGNRKPVTNKEYWKNKITRNIGRFTQQLHLLDATGWRVLTVWECELKNMDGLLRAVFSYLLMARCLDSHACMNYIDKRYQGWNLQR
ncbi:MAG: very short patch repair endonuclease [Candidatus Thiodiazotropha sp. (ex Lucinoma kastoroae)]|nr:very short patch repair endonuclease [Candidatus Thiodiazotropha sp. (ex Lucinoma kastoroae)]MCU7862227.1 very short patch repair endonuclease [Candidatus Thiodiazotropha sp. (ex Lucinoma kastoroae)]